MTPLAVILGNSRVRLWGIDGATRLERQLGAAGIVLVRRVGAGEALPWGDPLLMLRGDHLFDDRVVRDLAASRGVLLLSGGAAVAACVDADVAERARLVLDGEATSAGLPGVAVTTPEALTPGWSKRLLKAAPAFVEPIRAADAPALERFLFDGSYKGVTDLVTKWVWPGPARAATRACAGAGIGPNTVTSASWLLAAAAALLFSRGAFAWGLVAAWAMTFLDTVDGKLARVTVTSTKLGHLFDHVLDLVHPPLWYFAWAWGFAGESATGGATGVVLACIVAGYVAGRLVEGAFDAWLAGFPMFSWKPLDSWLRLVLARRNPNLLLLSGFLAAGRPADGLVAVAAWTVASTVLLVVRLAQAAAARSRGGELSSWLAAFDDARGPLPAHARPFVSIRGALAE